MKHTNQEQESKNAAKKGAIIHCKGMIEQFEQLRKPEYTTFVIEYGEPGLSMDGYEKINFYQQVLEYLNKK